MTTVSSSQAAAEYVMLSAQGAIHTMQALTRDARIWIGDHPVAVAIAAVVFVFLLWATRSRAV